MKTRKFTQEEIAKWDQEQIRMEQVLDGYSVWKIITCATKGSKQYYI